MNKNERETKELQTIEELNVLEKDIKGLMKEGTQQTFKVVDGFQYKIGEKVAKAQELCTKTKGLKFNKWLQKNIPNLSRQHAYKMIARYNLGLEYQTPKELTFREIADINKQKSTKVSHSATKPLKGDETKQVDKPSDNYKELYEQSLKDLKSVDKLYIDTLAEIDSLKEEIDNKPQSGDSADSERSNDYKAKYEEAQKYGEEQRNKLLDYMKQPEHEEKKPIRSQSNTQEVTQEDIIKIKQDTIEELWEEVLPKFKDFVNDSTQKKTTKTIYLFLESMSK